jgi:hypothetical protein
MQRSLLPDGFTEPQRIFLNSLMDDLFGDPIELESDPTTAGGELKPNEIGFNPTSGNLFVNLFGTTYIWANLTAV